MELLKQKNFKIGLLIVLVLIISIGAIYFNNRTKAEGIVAKVNNESITKDDLYEALVAENGKAVLDMLITNKIIDLELKKQNLSITEEDIQKEYKLLQSNMGSKKL